MMLKSEILMSKKLTSFFRKKLTHYPRHSFELAISKYGRV